MRDSIVFYDNWGRLLLDLPESQRLELIDMVFNYSFNDIERESDDTTVNAIFNMIREKLDEDADKYEAAKHRKSYGGKKGMESRWHNKVITNDNYVITRHNIVKDSITPITDTVTDTVTVTDIEKESIKEKDNTVIRRRFAPPSLQEVTDYVNSKGYSVDPQAFIDFYESKGWMIGKNKMKSWQSAVGTWERRQKKDRKPNPFKEFPQNKYDYDSLESKIIANK